MTELYDASLCKLSPPSLSKQQFKVILKIGLFFIVKTCVSVRPETTRRHIFQQKIIGCHLLALSAFAK